MCLILMIMEQVLKNAGFRLKDILVGEDIVDVLDVTFHTWC